MNPRETSYMLVVERSERVDFYGPYTLPEASLLLGCEDHPAIRFADDSISAYIKVLEWADPEERI